MCVAVPAGAISRKDQGVSGQELSGALTYGHHRDLGKALQLLLVTQQSLDTV